MGTRRSANASHWQRGGTDLAFVEMQAGRIPMTTRAIAICAIAGLMSAVRDCRLVAGGFPTGCVRRFGRANPCEARQRSIVLLLLG